MKERVVMSGGERSDVCDCVFVSSPQSDAVSVIVGQQSADAVVAAAAIAAECYLSLR